VSFDSRSPATHYGARHCVSAEYHQQQLILPTLATLIIMTMERPQRRIKKKVSEAAAVSEIDPIILKETAAIAQGGGPNWNWGKNLMSDCSMVLSNKNFFLVYHLG
jgi:hypothetical protein